METDSEFEKQRERKWSRRTEKMNLDFAMTKKNAIDDTMKRIPIVNVKMSKKNWNLDTTRRSRIVDAMMTSQCKTSINQTT